MKNEELGEELIAVRPSSRCSLITVKNWDRYQQSEEPSEEPGEEQNEHRVRTIKEDKQSKKERNKLPYVCRTETTSLLETISELCAKYGVENKVDDKALDIIVERYVGKIRMKVEAQHCLAWMVDKGLRVLSTQRIGNWFKKAQEFQKRDQLKQLEWKEAQVNPAMAERRKALKVKQDGLALDQSVHDFLSSQPPQA